MGIIIDQQNGFTGSITWNFIRSIYLNDENTFQLPNYDYGNLKIAYTISPIKIYMNIENLFNKRYNSTGYVLFGTTFLYPATDRKLILGFELEY